MIIKPNWDVFKAKFSENPQNNFEWFCYLLFCIEFNLAAGLFRYKNQSGIETNPITKDNEVIGWQAKFYETSLSVHKKDMVEMLRKVNRDYPDLTKILFYTNQEWGQGRLQNDPQVKIDIETEASKYNIQIEWRAASFFETPFVTLENQIYSKYFFSLDDSVIDSTLKMRRHTESLLQEIQTSIVFNEHKLELDRSQILQKLNKELEQKAILIISGEGGVGKTAVIKNLYKTMTDSTPFYMLRANEFEISDIDQLFGESNLVDFIKAHNQDNHKMFVIDSAEKLMALSNTTPFKEFLSVMLQNEWKILFTARSQYLLDINIHFIDNYHLTPSKFIINNLSKEELGNLAKEYNFNIPSDSKLLELITNPFYLNEYLRNHTDEANIGYIKFKELLWNKIIKKARPSREQCFLQVALKRANENQFYVTLDSLNSHELNSLVEDGILGYETAGYFITHDIYEEWALERIIQSEFKKKENNTMFLDRIGDALAVRRSFRNWISEKLFIEAESVKGFIEELIEDEHIKSFWKDEVMISVLLSDYSDSIFSSFERFFLDKGLELLQRISFLLRISCKEVDNHFFEQLGLRNIDILAAQYIFTRPIGNGWCSVIKFVHKNLDEIGLENASFIMPIVYDWNEKFREGEITKFSGLIALKYYQWIVKEKIYLPHDEDTKEKLLETILYGAFELKNELTTIFDEVIANKEKDHRAPYYDLVEMLLTKVPTNIEVIKVLPEYVLQLADVFWFRSYDDLDMFHSSLGVGEYFCIDERMDRYFPASAYQTPTYWLLKCAFPQTINFILDFTNKTVEAFSKSDFARNEVSTTEVYVDDKSYKQYICDRLWNIYRGTQVAPDVLESMHMALEKYLLEVAKNIDPKILEDWLLYLLKNTKSASITAVVVSVVLAHPEKTFNVAIKLFKSKNLFFYDTHRMVHDQSAKLNYSIGYGLNYNSKLYQDERIETCNDQHRKKSLESMVLEYQFFRAKEVSEDEADNRLKAIWDVLDAHYKVLSEGTSDNEQTKTWRIYLARMDRRKMNPTLEETDEGILINFNPELETEVREYSESSIKQSSEKMKYTSLKLWANYRMKGDEKYKQYNKYETDPILALKESQDILSEFERLTSADKPIHQQNDAEEFFLLNASIPSEVCSVLIRDFLNLISDEEKLFCKEIIIGKSTSSFRPNYMYQISDGVESAISVLPVLMREFPEEKNEIKRILLMILFDPNSIGMYADFADFSVNAILKYLWECSFEDAQSILVGYLLLSLEYESVRKKLFEENRKQGIFSVKEFEVIEAFANKNEELLQKVIENEISINDLGSLNDHEFNNLVTAFRLIPLATDHPDHINISQKIISIIASKLILNERENRIDYSDGHHFLVKLSMLVLSSSEKHIPLYLEPFINQFSNSKVFSDMFKQFIYAEDSLKTYGKFWRVWYAFSDKVIELASKGDGYWYVGDIIKSYLFANVQWGEKVIEWHAFREEDNRFFKSMMRELVHCPSALYAIAKLLNGVGSRYLSAGIVWISELINNNDQLWKSKLDANTVYYLESLLKKHIHEKREEIRKWNKQKNDVLIILDFLVEKGSVVGYMLRENIL